MNTPMTNLMRLLDEAFDILYAKNLGVNHAEPVFIGILDNLRTNASARQWFMQKAVQEITSGPHVIPATAYQNPRPPDFVDEYLISYIAHATRWPEFAAACETRKLSSAYARKMPGSHDIADDVDAALSDNWEDREFYPTLSATDGK